MMPIVPALSTAWVAQRSARLGLSPGSHRPPDGADRGATLSYSSAN